MVEYYKEKIPEERRVTLHDHDNHAEMKLKIRHDGAWNTGLALASGTELKLIFVHQYKYPLHLVEEIINTILVFFKKGPPMVMPGSMKASFRPSYIGPRYSKCVGWMPLTAPQLTNPFRTIPDAYVLYKDLIEENENPLYEWKGRTQVQLARDLISRAAVVC